MDTFPFYLRISISKRVEDRLSSLEVIVLELVYMQAIGQVITWQAGIFLDFPLMVIFYSKFSGYKWLVQIFADFIKIRQSSFAQDGLN